ncbi:MAG: type II toxin-antitoxin system HicB family antitoxin [Patescibacteria group bacterium]|jgi:predicted RNase H-like HicB family nuclease
MKKQITKVQYPAVFDPIEEGGYNVSFPDFPGCVTFGRDFEEAKAKAQEVLQLWLEELAHEGESIIIHKNKVYPIITEVMAKLPAQAEIVYAATKS